MTDWSNATAANPLLDLRAAFDAMQAADDARRQERANRARSVGDWFDSLPEHARRHSFVRALTSQMINGIVTSQRMADAMRSYVDRISTMTPEEADADSRKAAESMYAEWERLASFGMPPF